MRRNHISIFIFMLIAALGCLPLTAQSSKEQQRFAGTWEAKFKGAVICTIKLDAGEKISGAMHQCRVHVDDDGDLVESEPSESDEPAPLLNPKVQDDTLSFETKDEPDEPTMKFEMKLTGEGRAELRFIDAPVPIKPIHFEKRS